MVTITSILNVNYGLYDEVWAIVRFLKYTNPRIRHVPELSPSWQLFKTYLSLKNKGQWNEETFRTMYVPRFLMEMRGKVQQDLLNELFNTKKHICLVCFCPDESLCHRSIVGGMLQGAGAVVHGLSADYSYYFDWWKNGVPGVPDRYEEPPAVKRLTEYNDNMAYLYKTDQVVYFSNQDTLCFTGRRPKDLCWYDSAKYRTFVDGLAALLYDEFYVKRGIRKFINGGAQGFDQMSFWAVNKMKKTHKCDDVQNMVFVSFEGQELRWAEKGLFSRAEYYMMIKNADAVYVVCEDNCIDSLFVRNHAMCDYSSICVGLYPDEGWRSAKGGTAECLRYASDVCEAVYRLGYEIDSVGLHIGEMVKI